MYHQYFGLNEAPFSIAVNPRYLFMSARHRDALAHLLYGVGTGGGFILLTGEVGTGKTTINRCLLEQLPHDTDIAIILNPALNAIELLATACDELGIGYDPDKHTLKTLTDKLHSFLLENHGKGRKTVLMIDEAQHLDFDVLEQIRLLTNLETNSEKLLQIILIGQPELGQLLARPELRQLNQRITARYNLEPLNQSETSAYIRHRLQVAGMAPDREIFPPAVVRGIYRRTRGIPRLINVLCDRIMLGAYGRNKSRADTAMLRLAAKEVMGEEGASISRLKLSIFVIAVLLMLLAATWWSQMGPASFTSVAARQALAPPIERVTEPEPAASLVKIEVEPAPGNWLLTPRDAAEIIWSYSTQQAFPGELCSSDKPSAPACVEAQASTWDELAVIDRPLLLDLITPERFAAAAILLGIEGRRAWLASSGMPVAIDLAELAPLWQGGYLFLWRVPAGFDRPLTQGDKGAVIARLAGLFAQLDGQERPLATQQFSPALKRRVILFQEAQGLEADGVVGVQTLLKLNEALGIDATASGVRASYAKPTIIVGQ